QGTYAQRHLRARDVRDLVQDGEPAPERTEARAAHHAPFSDPGVSRGLPDDGVRQVGESHPRLEYSLELLKDACGAFSPRLTVIAILRTATKGVAFAAQRLTPVLSAHSAPQKQ